MTIELTGFVTCSECKKENCNAFKGKVIRENGQRRFVCEKCLKIIEGKNENNNNSSKL